MRINEAEIKIEVYFKIRKSRSVIFVSSLLTTAITSGSVSGAREEKKDPKSH
jgi:hypothetical protein